MGNLERKRERGHAKSLRVRGARGYWECKGILHFLEDGMEDELALISGDRWLNRKGSCRARVSKLLPRGQVQPVVCFYMAES